MKREPFNPITTRRFRNRAERDAAAVYDAVALKHYPELFEPISASKIAAAAAGAADFLQLGNHPARNLIVGDYLAGAWARNKGETIDLGEASLK